MNDRAVVQRIPTFLKKRFCQKSTSFLGLRSKQEFIQVESLKFYGYNFFFAKVFLIYNSKFQIKQKKNDLTKDAEKLIRKVQDYETMQNELMEVMPYVDMLIQSNSEKEGLQKNLKKAEVYYCINFNFVRILNKYVFIFHVHFYFFYKYRI